MIFVPVVFSLLLVFNNKSACCRFGAVGTHPSGGANAGEIDESIYSGSRS